MLGRGGPPAFPVVRIALLGCVCIRGARRAAPFRQTFNLLPADEESLPPRFPRWKLYWAGLCLRPYPLQYRYLRVLMFY